MKLLILFIFFFAYVNLIKTQNSIIYNENKKNFKKGLYYFDKEKYSLAQYFFEKYLEQKDKNDYLLIHNSEYYKVICALELFNANTDKLVEDYLYFYRENNKSTLAKFFYSRYKFNRKHFNEAIKWFEKINPDELEEEEKSEYYFKLGYSYFVNDDYDKAEKLFYEIKDKPNSYYEPANYFYSHIAYQKGNYETALKGFLRLQDSEVFKDIVSYYIGQIYFFQKEYTLVIEYVEPKLKYFEGRKKLEMEKLVGISYYKLNKFNLALPYLEKYIEETKDYTPRDLYEISYAYYQTGRIGKAIEYLEKMPLKEDSLTQQSLFLLAQCYLLSNLKNQARLALSRAAKMNFFPDIQEEALYTFAKLSFELDFSPFNEAINSFNDFLQKFPNSKYVDEVKLLLSKAYLYSKNYHEVINIIKDINDTTPEIELILIKSSFYLGLEYFKNSQYEDAIKYFDMSLNYSKNNINYVPYSLFWKAEVYYKLGNYKNAIDNYIKFIQNPLSYSTNFYFMAYYNIGYCFYNLNDYNNSQMWFRKYIDNEKDTSKVQYKDAFLRLADCFFVLKRYEEAIDLYLKVYKFKQPLPDYALYQLGKCYSIMNRYENSIATYNKLINEYPLSAYYHYAIYDLAVEYEKINNINEAIRILEDYIKNYPNSLIITKVMLKLAQIYFNEDKDILAEEYLKKIIENYPNSSEFYSAITTLKNLYLEKNDVKGYFSYLKEKVKNFNLDLSEKDSLMYITAEKFYLKSDITNATKAFIDYLNTYPNGIFKINAYYYLAECYFKEDKIEEALNYYKTIINEPFSKFTVPALLRLSNYYYNKKDYESSIDYFLKIIHYSQNPELLRTANVHLMKSYYYLNDLEQAFKYAQEVLKEKGNISEDVELEGTFIIGKYYYVNERFIEAYVELEKIIKDCKTKIEAESYYLIIEILFKQKKFDEAEDKILSFAKKNTPHIYWVAKSYLILGEIYLEKENLFQAKAIFQSIIDNYKEENDGIKEEARQRISYIEKLENLKKETE